MSLGVAHHVVAHRVALLAVVGPVVMAWMLASLGACLAAGLSVMLWEK